MAFETGLRVKIDSTGARTGATEVQNALTRMRVAGQQAIQSFFNLRNAIAGLGLGLLIRQIVRTADTFQLIRNRLRLVTDNTRQLARVQRDLFEVAQNTRSSYESTAELYARVARSSDELGLSQERLLGITETVQQAIRVSGATAQEATAGVIQFAQGLASSRLSGDELRSVLEQMPRLARAIATGMGISIGQLREFGEEGKLTADAVITALENQATVIRDEFAQLDITVGESLQQLRNSFGLFADEVGRSGLSQALIDINTEMRVMSEEGTGLATVLGSTLGVAVRGAADAFKLLAENLEVVVVFVGALAGARLGRLAGMWGAVAGAVGGAALAFKLFSELEDATLANLPAEAHLARLNERFINLTNALVPLERHIQSITDAEDEQRQAAVKLRDEIIEQLAVTGDTIQKLELWIAIQAELNEFVDEAGVNLAKLNEELKRAQDFIARYEGALAGRLNAEFERSITLIRTFTERVREARDALRDVRDENDRVGESLRRQLLTPTEAYNEELARLNLLHREGAISLETYQRGLAAAHDRLAEATEVTREMGPLMAEVAALAEGAFSRIGATITEAFVQGKQSMIEWRNVALAIISEIIQAIIRLAVINTIINSITGGAANLPTLFGGAGAAEASGAGVGFGRVLGGQASTGAITGQHGLDFMVGGSGGTDSQFVPMMLTPGERVQVTPPGHASSGGGQGGTTIVIDARGSNGEASIERAISRALRRAAPAMMGGTENSIRDGRQRDPLRNRGI